ASSPAYRAPLGGEHPDHHAAGTLTFVEPKPFKIPHSVLVVIHTPSLMVLLVNRADMPDYWQSVTGSKDSIDEPLETTARREVMEETGIDCAMGVLEDWNLENIYDIYPHWLHRYEPGVTRNTEHVFGLCVPEGTPVRLNP